MQIVMCSPPILGGEPITSGIDESGPVVTFTLTSGDLDRFANALRDRGQVRKRSLYFLSGLRVLTRYRNAGTEV